MSATILLGLLALVEALALMARALLGCAFHRPPSLVWGVAGIRDRDHPCELFSPGEPAGDCEGDGHCLCRGCSRRTKENGHE